MIYVLNTALLGIPALLAVLALAELTPRPQPAMVKASVAKHRSRKLERSLHF